MTATAPFRLPEPAGGGVDLLVVAGEHSGDEHAARMVRGLLRAQPGTRVCALGGPRLAAAGAQLLHDRTALSVVGLGEVLRNLGAFAALIDGTVDWIGRHRPRAVCFVDNSGINLRIAEALRRKGISTRGGGGVRALYYISPQVWASRPARRFEMARNLDALAVIFPFEVGCYADTGLDVTFVGHPFLEPDYAPPVAYDPAGPVLLLPGSRTRPVERIFPVLLEAHARFAADKGGRDAVALYPSDPVLRALEAQHPPAAVRLARTGPTVGASAVLTTSGTMSMHCALAGIPGAVAYRTDLLTYFMGRWLVNVPYLGIANILLGEAAYPEYIQGAATPAALAGELAACVHDPERRAGAARTAAALRALLAGRGPGGAAQWLLGHLG
jgi:lipid-A-disaccharide synthase